MDIVRIRAMKEWISQLPSGNITYKTISGKRYAYYQWTENGKQHGRRVKDDELKELQEKIEQRKVLQSRLKEAEASPASDPAALQEEYFFSEVKRGNELLAFVDPVRKLKKRECIQKLHDYVHGDSTDRVFILYGLRRTGKTTMIRQVIAEMPEEMLAKTAFIQITENVDMAKINLDLRTLAKQGYRYVFIDEVTLMSDFVEGAALFSDVFASSGMKLVLSGTDSLGFVFSEDQELYDRCFMLHTTFIPYREFERVLGIKGIDEYIRYGGTMSLGGVHYNRTGMTFATKESADEYVNSAIARNIQHSLKNYRDGDHFRSLTDLYEANELTNAINRIVEDINHAFTIEVLTRTFVSHDLGLSARNLRNDPSMVSNSLDVIDKEAVTQRLQELLEIKNKADQTVIIQDIHRHEIKEYLDFLDLTIGLDEISMSDLSVQQRTAIAQPGLRYAQAEALIKSLMEDQIMRALSLVERNAVTERILDEIKGRMMEDIVLLETKIARPDCNVFKLRFAVGEFDMVVFNPTTASCEIFEIKHSTACTPQQYRHLVDENKCKETEHRYGTITGKYVLYRGEEQTLDHGVSYLNVEAYLNHLTDQTHPT